MDVGVTQFMTDRTWHPGEVAAEVEQRGFSSLWTPEHTHIPVSRATPAPTGRELSEMYRRTLDPFVALSWAAAATTRLRLGTGIALMAQRDPIVTAKEAATLDLLSGGRFTLGVGFGWNAEELADHGVAMADRVAVVRERVEAMQALWADEVASYQGRHVSLSPSWAWPKPVQRVTRPGPDGTPVERTGVPVVIGGNAGRGVLRQVAAWADGWMPMVSRVALEEALSVFRAEVEAAGRDPATVSLRVFSAPPKPENLDRLEALGVQEYLLPLPSAGRDEVLRALDEFAPLLDR